MEADDQRSLANLARAVRRLDLTQPLGPDASSPPGLPPARIERVRTMASHGRNSTVLAMSVHTGTHLDAPLHISDNGVDVSRIPLDDLIGPTVVWSIPIDEPRAIEVADLERGSPALESGDFVFLSTGWARYYGTARYRAGPWLSVHAAEWLVAHNARLVGIDLKGPEAPPSAEPGGGPAGPQPGVDFRVHRALLDHGVLLVENLGDMEPIVGRRVLANVLPIPLIGSDGAPARVFVEY